MTRRGPRGLAAASAAAALCIGGCAQTPVRSPEFDTDYPADLVAYMTEHGCRPDPAAMKSRRPGSKPPYAYGFVQRDGVATWCYRTYGGQRRNVLLIRAPESSFSCRKELETALPIGGLSIGSASFIDSLNGFTRADGQNAPPLAGGIDLPNEHIVSSRPGDIVVFTCHQGEWWSYRFE
ncbi:hypothetical protein SVA_2625 [Sulfurifustis variabilis]|uniref:Lipoprotein n=1 Tax=Sulfurifustis variabilis TaxID=1675686 RepID=A0A1B4V6J6_9GAMM|nr:hypothetical protein [Sulfurifustis variabilis]BAU49173.1 hypothetical protein SVA_2625 [Sulfurifustis variabilis]